MFPQRQCRNPCTTICQNYVPLSILCAITIVASFHVQVLRAPVDELFAFGIYEAVASSEYKNCASFRKARAIEIRWRSPPESSSGFSGEGLKPICKLIHQLTVQQQARALPRRPLRLVVRVLRSQRIVRSKRGNCLSHKSLQDQRAGSSGISRTSP